MVSFAGWFALTLLVALLLAIVIVILVRELNGPAEPAPQKAAAPPGRISRFEQFLRRCAVRLAGGNDLDTAPLVAVIGADAAAVRRLVQPGAEAAPEELLGLGLSDARIATCAAGAVVYFEDGLLSSAHREGRWRAALHALSHQREDRPLDGLVIVVPAGALIGPSRLSADELAGLGGRLYQLLLLAQQSGGWRAPVYLIVNQCEALNGFAETAAELRRDMVREPFGWTTPYGLDTAFERRWVREGITALSERLSALQIKLLTSLRNDSAEAVLLFPHAVEQLAEPLAALLTPMLQPSAYHEAFMFRGFYLTGAAGPNAPSDGLDRFAPHLFSQRIFPEHFLAQPARGAQSRRRRQIRIAQGALAALAILAVIGLVQVRKRRAAVTTVLPLVEQIADLGQRATAGAAAPIAAAPIMMSPGAASDGEEIEVADTRALIQAMSGASLDRLETAWAPLSYLTGATGDVEQAIREAYGVEVLRVVGHRLTHAVPALLGAVPNEAGAAAEAPAAAAACTSDDATTVDGARFAQLIDRLEEYQQQLRNYQELTQNPQIENLKSLLEFTLGVSLPPGFTTNYDLYQDALQNARAPLLDIAPIRAAVGRVVRAEFEHALNHTYPGSPLALAVGAIEANAGVEPGAEAPAVALVRLRRLAAGIQTAEMEAPRPAYAWLRDERGAAGIDAAIARLAKLGRADTVMGPVVAPAGLASQLRGLDRACASYTRQELRTAQVFDGIPILTPGAGLSLSAPLQNAGRALAQFLAQPVATTEITSAAAASTIPGDAPLLWDYQDLQGLQSATAAYILFVAQDLPATLPAGFRTQVQAAAGAQLDAMVRAAVAHAAQNGAAGVVGFSSGGYAPAREEIARFGAALPILIDVRTSLNSAGHAALAQYLDALMTRRALRLLRQIDATLAASNPYLPINRNLSFWPGQPPLAAPAFGAIGTPELAATMPARRNYVQGLAQDEAAPLVDYLSQHTLLLGRNDRTLLTRWQGILSTLDRYSRGDAANSLTRLEQFIGVGMDQITLGDCVKSTAATRGGADWFAVQLANLGQEIRQRCAALTHQNALAEYDSLAAAFNNNLAGRFPFGGLATPDADPVDVADFFNRFGAELPKVEAELAEIPAYVQSGAARFVQKLIAVQTALAPLLAPGPDPALTYRVTFDFRTNIGEDPEADQIYETKAQFGSQQVTSFGASHQLAWTSGQDAKVMLRWATEAPNLPLDGAGIEAPSVRGLTATYAFSGAWALLRMIVAQRPAPAVMAQLSQRRPETVVFRFPLGPNPSAPGYRAPARCTNWILRCPPPAIVSPPSIGRVFMRLALVAVIQAPGQPEQHKPVRLPVFPYAAPQ